VRMHGPKGGAQDVRNTKVQEHFERANARPEGWSTGCAE